MREFTLWLERHNYSRSTIRNYQARIADLAGWLAEHHRPPLGRCTWRDIRQYALTKRDTYATRSGLRAAMNAYWKFRRWGEPLSWAVPQPKQPRGRYRGLKDATEKERVLAAARELGVREYVALCGLYYQGLRREECARLRWDNVIEGRVRGVGKGNQEFDEPLHPKFAQALLTLTPEGPWVFPGRCPGTHVSPNTVWMWTRLAGAGAGLGRVTPHQMRHTSIATVLEATGNVRTAMTFARHVNPKTTMIYTRTLEAELEQGMAAL